MIYGVPSLYKAPLLVASGVWFYIASTPPNAAPKEEETKRYGDQDLLSRFFPWRKAAVLAGLSYWLSIAAESTVLVASAYPTLPISRPVLNALIPVGQTAHAISLPPSWLCGFAALTLGGALRLASYRHLGSLFTFHLTIRDEHKLITSGPYALVRHPSYLGAILTMGGMLVCMFGPGSWLAECGWLETIAGKALCTGVVGWALYMSAMLLGRVPTEDRMLRKEFGKEWDQWARRTPYAVVPGLF
ncbi:hypothetical protein EWM64_g7027 [Hericium alpestre]|uniref:Protein-S-isoprenylcysteine O-methyltransferase n=1 Tax=Hericium alpestre TaxID=135208 RepID=A0A4Y9ZQX6_9AGAM|nr:hypothetical protein EWM64_g7027 [Hericium alpestre]